MKPFLIIMFLNSIISGLMLTPFVDRLRKIDTNNLDNQYDDDEVITINTNITFSCLDYLFNNEHCSVPSTNKGQCYYGSKCHCSTIGPEHSEILRSMFSIFVVFLILTFTSFIPCCLNSTALAILRLTYLFTIYIFQNDGACVCTTDPDACSDISSVCYDYNHRLSPLNWISFSLGIINLFGSCLIIAGRM